MQELERLYRHLVATMTASGAPRWQDPILLADLMALIPYRTGRRALGIDSSEEYELLILRLAGGEGSYMHTEPEAVGQRFGNEAVSVNPDLGVLREFRDARLMFVPAALMRVLQGGTADEEWAPRSERGPAVIIPEEKLDGPDPEPAARAPAPPRPSAPSAPRPAAAESPRAPAPPRPSAPSPPRPSAPVSAPSAAPVSTPGAGNIEACIHCRRVLPVGRNVKFCPYCGGSQTAATCPACNEEIELSWKHCVNCGATLTQGHP